MLRPTFLLLIAQLATAQTWSLSGKVVLEDGTAPPAPVRVQLSVQGRVVSQVETDTSGNFSFATSLSQAASDASYRSKTPDAQRGAPGYASFELKFTLAGFEPRTALFEDWDLRGSKGSLGTFVLKRAKTGPGADAAYLAAPKAAREAYDRAKSAAEKQDWAKSLAQAERAIGIAGIAFPAPYLVSADAAMQLGKVDDAERRARELVEAGLAGSYPRAEFILGFASLAKRDAAGAERHLKTYLQLAPETPEAEKVKKLLERIRQ